MNELRHTITSKNTASLKLALKNMVKDKRKLLIFRIVMVGIGFFIIVVSIVNQIKDNYFFSKGIITQGKVIDISGLCSPIVTFKDKNNFDHTAYTSTDCEGFYSKPEIGDLADILYSAENPKYAKVIKVYSANVIHDYGIYRWKIESLAFSMFGLALIVMAFIPKKFR